MAEESLVNKYLDYLKSGISYEDLYNMMQYDYDLYIKRENGELIDIQTSIQSKLDAKIRYESLKKAYEILNFSPYILVMHFSIQL